MPTVFVAGASRGIGREFCRQYAGDGWKVIATIRDPAASAVLAAYGPTVQSFFMDVADPDSIRRVSNTLGKKPIDLLICNAAIKGQSNPFSVTDYRIWEMVHRVNVMGPWATVEALIENVLQSDLKQIIFLSSRSASISSSQLRDSANPTDEMYWASKAALNSLMRTLSYKFAGLGLTMISLSPGSTITEFDLSGPPRDSTKSQSVDIAVSKMRRVIAALSADKNGKFFDNNGNEIS